MDIKEPTGEQCSAFEKVFEDEDHVCYAVWYPQMGGYSGKAVAVFGKGWQERNDGAAMGGCIEVYVWHDGAFPFSEEPGINPAHLHHCSPDQFIDFGKKLEKINESLKILVENFKDK